MLKIPYEEIIKKIKEKSNLSEEEINFKISEKLNQLSGLISKEGAAHIIANELGIKLLEEYTGRLQIKNILPGIRNLETIGKVISKRDLYEFTKENRTGKVASFMLGDETGTIRVTLWGSQADRIREIQEKDLIKIVGGYVKENNGQKEIHLNERSHLIINPREDVKINISYGSRKKLNELTENDNSVEVLGHIVQAFNPSFFEICPKCSKRIKQGENGFKCDAHGNVIPDYSYALNLVIDDGTDTIRAVFFREHLEKLLKSNKDEIIKFREEPESFNAIKSSLMGAQLKLLGSVNRNSMFNRLEFTVRGVSEANAEEELKRLSGAENINLSSLNNNKE